jgi:predicted N-acetyltransferase YhbS
MRTRRLTLVDVPAAARLTDAAFGGGPREDRLRRYLAIEPRGWFVVEETGLLVAVGGVVRFGTFAWLGLMAVRPERQRQGLGRTIAEEAIGWALGQGCSTVFLIATPAGIPLYARLGFVPAGESEELGGTPAPAARPSPPARCRVERWTAADTAEVGRFDAPAFGADRTHLLSVYAQEFPASSWVARDGTGAIRGFLVIQGGSLGPWSADDDATAAQLLDVGLPEVSEPLRAGVPDPGAAALLLARGSCAPGRSPGCASVRRCPPVTRRGSLRMQATRSVEPLPRRAGC